MLFLIIGKVWKVTMDLESYFTVIAMMIKVIIYCDEWFVWIEWIHKMKRIVYTGKMKWVVYDNNWMKHLYNSGLLLYISTSVRVLRPRTQVEINGKHRKTLNFIEISIEEERRWDREGHQLLKAWSEISSYLFSGGLPQHLRKNIK